MTVTADIDCAVDALEKGCLVVMPTDTVYGVASLPTSDGVEKIYRAKERDRDKPIPLLAENIDAVIAYGAVMSKEELWLAERFWPGPLTLVVKTVRPGEEDSSEGFRVPGHDMARELLSRVGGVLRVTSANVSNRPPALSAQEAEEALAGSVEVVLDGGPADDSVPSTVVSASCGCVEILREGVITLEEIKKVLNEKEA